ncbi:hypothetical protein BO71DRAFT_480947 [Aspergillus ellipticus CBS 707.79]|uniref:Uncharacterized protein n=1 Tax=Aspergillus ellipticus CBS 707.79 TaxID=1448320 RepID=A0A319DJP4_9EURO|nr:hypothetical protein BO71DRAFT_480947 [Aspergillus ellipticus CBS 707.79]
MHHHHKHQALHGTHLSSRPVPRRPGIVPHHRLPFLATSEAPTLVRREPLPSTESSASQSSSASDKPTSTLTTTTLPVVLGAVIPIVCAIAVLLYLHRRNVKKLRNEDANDKHKSLDFGLDLAPTGARPMQQAEKTDRNAAHAKGVSLDIGPSPYLLPPGLQSSRESLHSLSRSIGDGDDDKYRHATSFLGDNTSLRSHPRGPHDDASSFTGSTRPGGLGDEMNQGLLRNAQRMSRSSPPLYNTRPGDHNRKSLASPDHERDTGFELNLPRSPSPVLVPGVTISELKSTRKSERDRSELRGSPENVEIDTHRSRPSQAPFEDTQHSSLAHTSNNSTNETAGLTHSHQHHANVPLHDPIPLHSNMAPVQPTSIPTPRISIPLSDATSDYGDTRMSNPAIPAVSVHDVAGDTAHKHSLKNSTLPAALSEEPIRSQNAGLETHRDTRRMTLGLRPLPPEDPSDNPEQRANRIRSFYKEYFDENKTGRETYYQDYGPELYEDGYVYDQMPGDHFNNVPAPFAEPVTRRAMTPPPRAPPRFQGAARHMATGSDGGFNDRFHSPGPRAFSSASGRLPGPQKPRKPVPPPSPLQILPTPHMLKDESIMSAIDYAPANHFKDQREGRPETPLGGLQPFSPAVPVHSPLVSAFDELSALPSAHALRKSGLYDNLDFALPPRFKNTDTGSDAGSIRSNRTGISTTHLNNIRTGAYRVSRLPPGTDI